MEALVGCTWDNDSRLESLRFLRRYHQHLAFIISDIEAPVEVIQMQSVRKDQLMFGCSDVTKASQRGTQNLYSTVVVISDEHITVRIHRKTTWSIQVTIGRIWQSAV